MAKPPKIVQMIPAPMGMSIVTEKRGGARITAPVVALGLAEDGSIRPVFIGYLKDDNVGTLKIGAEDALLYPPRDGD